MKELNDIIRAYENAAATNKQMALVTVVRVEGSSYRRPGARMLVTEDGEITGAISGGCLEGDALKKARLAMHQGRNKLEVYDTTDEADARLGVQLGCNGTVYILFEPLSTDDQGNPVHLLKQVAAKRTASVLLTVFNESRVAVQRGTRYLIGDGHPQNNGEIPVLEEGFRALEAGSSRTASLGQDTVLAQYIPPTPRLLIAGAGNDAQPLVEMASLLGWETVVIDGRPDYATRLRFPGAGEIVVTRPDAYVKTLGKDPRTALVLMTHHYEYDREALREAAATGCQYIGLLGPRMKLHRMLEDLKDGGMVDTDSLEKRVFSPVGLDIGAETAEEIALAILAEIQAVFSSREGLPLKNRTSAIHNRIRSL